MKITSLLENTTHRADMQTEHGLSLYIETEQYHILFDMGQTDLFVQNAKKPAFLLPMRIMRFCRTGITTMAAGLRRFLR